MDTNIDVSALKTLFPGLSEEELAQLAQNLEKEFGNRLTIALTDFLDKNTAMELATLSHTGDAKAIGEWIALHVPDYKEITQDEYDILMGDLVKDPNRFMGEVKPDSAGSK